MNAAGILGVLASAAAMFLLARLSFFAGGGWPGGAGPLCGSYFVLSLFFFSALEGFLGFLFFSPPRADGMSFALGWSHLLLAIVVWILIARNRKLGDRAWLMFFGAAAVVLCVLMLHNARWIWDHVSLLQNVWYPWRLLGAVA